MAIATEVAVFNVPEIGHGREAVGCVWSAWLAPRLPRRLNSGGRFTPLREAYPQPTKTKIPMQSSRSKSDGGFFPKGLGIKRLPVLCCRSFGYSAGNTRSRFGGQFSRRCDNTFDAAFSVANHCFAKPFKLCNVETAGRTGEKMDVKTDLLANRQPIVHRPGIHLRGLTAVHMR